MARKNSGAEILGAIALAPFFLIYSCYQKLTERPATPAPQYRVPDRTPAMPSDRERMTVEFAFSKNGKKSISKLTLVVCNLDPQPLLSYSIEISGFIRNRSTPHKIFPH